MEIKLREQVRLKATGKLGIVTGWERKLDNNGSLIERYTVRFDEPVMYWYPCSAVGEAIPGFKEIKVHGSQIERLQLDSMDDYLDAMRYAMYGAFAIPKEQLVPKRQLFVDTSHGAITIKLPYDSDHKWFSIRDEHGVREYKPNPTKSLDCECGKEKHGFASHSNWCPKKENT